MREKEIPFRNGIEFTADVVSDSDWLDLMRAIGGAIRKSALSSTGLQEYCGVPRTDELLRSVKLYSTGNTTKEQVDALLRSVPGIVGVRDSQMLKVVWSEKYDPEFEIVFPDLCGPSIPPGIEFASGETPRVVEELDYELDGSYDEDSAFVSDIGIGAEDIQITPSASPSTREEDISRIIRKRNSFRKAKAMWKSRHQPDKDWNPYK